MLKLSMARADLGGSEAAMCADDRSWDRARCHAEILSAIKKRISNLDRPLIRCTKGETGSRRRMAARIAHEMKDLDAEQTMLQGIMFVL